MIVIVRNTSGGFVLVGPNAYFGTTHENDRGRKAVFVVCHGGVRHLLTDFMPASLADGVVEEIGKMLVKLANDGRSGWIDVDDAVLLAMQNRAVGEFGPLGSVYGRDEAAHESYGGVTDEQ